MKRNFIRDILRDTDSKKFSTTKFAALITLTLLTASVGSAIWIMIINREIDHIMIGELIALLLTLLGYKNAKDRKKLMVDKEKQLSHEVKPEVTGDKLDERDGDQLG